jgi:hypothetical protein
MYHNLTNDGTGICTTIQQKMVPVLGNGPELFTGVSEVNMRRLSTSMSANTLKIKRWYQFWANSPDFS